MPVHGVCKPLIAIGLYFVSSGFWLDRSILDIGRPNDGNKMSREDNPTKSESGKAIPSRWHLGGLRDPRSERAASTKSHTRLVMCSTLEACLHAGS